MLKDKILVYKAKNGCKESMRCIYEKNKNQMLTLANALLNDRNSAEDVIHDVFLKFAEDIEDFKLKVSLKSYFATCTRNLVYDRIRTHRRHLEKHEHLEPVTRTAESPEKTAIRKENNLLVKNALGQLAIEQSEAVVMRIRAGLSFREIAKMQGVSVNTVQGRYRYGLDKLRSLLNGKASK